MRYRATVAYDGARYAGFQRLTDKPSVQAALEAAIAQVTGQAARILGGARTDTGVHAVGNVVTFDLNRWPHGDAKLIAALNATLPIDIAIQRLALADPTFHPRFDAASRVYRYVVHEARERNPITARTAWQRHGDHALDAMNIAAALIVGTHDFATFGNPTAGTSTTRTVIRSAWSAKADENAEMGGDKARFLVYDVEADGFLHHMVRALVGSLVEVGAGRWTVERFAEAFDARNRSRALVMAPPHGLTLIAIRYDENRPRDVNRAAFLNEESNELE